LYRDLDSFISDIHAYEPSDPANELRPREAEVALEGVYEADETAPEAASEIIEVDTFPSGITIPEERGADADAYPPDQTVLQMGQLLTGETATSHQPDEIFDSLAEEDAKATANIKEDESADTQPPAIADDGGQEPPGDTPRTAAAEMPEEEPEGSAPKYGLPDVIDNPREYALTRVEAAKPGLVDELREAFEPYRPQVKAIDTLLDAGTAPEEIPRYITSGGNCHVFDTPDGKILKLPRSPRIDTGLPEDPLFYFTAPLAIGQGEEGLEQIIAGGEDNEVSRGGVVCEPAPGTTLANYDDEAIRAIPVEHFCGLMEEVITLTALGLVSDTHLDNTFHHPDRGFTIIDYELHLADDPPNAAVEAASYWSLIEPEPLWNPSPIPLEETNFYQAYKEVFGEAALPILEGVARFAQGYEGYEDFT
jgi:hypothetical protein